jgi:hypothetical protein
MARGSVAGKRLDTVAEKRIHDKLLLGLHPFFSALGLPPATLKCRFDVFG